MAGILIFLTIGLPWLGALLVWQTGDDRPRQQHRLAVAFSVAAGIAALALIPLHEAGVALRVDAGGVFGEFTFVPDGLGVFLAAVATVVGSLAVIFSVDYMRGAAQLGRYYALVLFFIGAMAGLVLAGSLLLLFIFWEITALCSYALISFYNDDPKAVAGGIKALIMTQVGGVGLLAGALLTYAYLGEWITRQKDGVKRGEEGAEDRLAAALELQKRLEAILAGEPPFDIFVRWKPLSEQAIGWEPDINDGVRLNIRPFMASDLPGGRSGAGILRYKPNIKWTKDRGKEPQRPKADYPWFWGWDEKTMDFMGASKFDGNRWNVCHYTNGTKQKARDMEKAGETKK